MQSVSRTYLARIKNTSRTTLWRRFASLLAHCPTPLAASRQSKPRVVIVDGFYLAYPSLKRNRHKAGFHRDKRILLWAIDSTTRRPIYWQFYDAIEDTGIWKKFIQEMKEYSFYPDYLVHDGHPGITRACDRYWPKAKQQRCLAHFMGNMNKDLGVSPKTELAKSLKQLVAALFTIKTNADKQVWQKRWQDYLADNQQTIEQLRKGAAVYQHGVRIPGLYMSALSVVNNAYKRDEVFTYLDKSEVPKTSNAIESLNGTLRELTRRHRGLALEHRKRLVAWALAYRQGQTRTQLMSHVSSKRKP